MGRKKGERCDASSAGTNGVPATHSPRGPFLYFQRGFLSYRTHTDGIACPESLPLGMPSFPPNCRDSFVPPSPSFSPVRVTVIPSISSPRPHPAQGNLESLRRTKMFPYSMGEGVLQKLLRMNLDV